MANSKSKKPADVLRDPEAAARTKRERKKYLSMPQVQRALTIEKQEKAFTTLEGGKGKAN